MGRLFVAADTAGPNLWFGLNPFGHSQIVYEISEGNRVETEILAPAFFGVTGEPWAFQTFGKPHNVPEEESGEKYGIYELALKDGQTAEFVWELLQQVSKSLEDNGSNLEYDTDPSQNSNSYVRTLLDVIGNTTDWGSAFSEDGMAFLPGWGRNVLELARVDGVLDFNGIPLEVSGTAGNDIINGGNDNDTIRGAGGEDTLRGGNGIDVLGGGSGADLFLGTPKELDGDTIEDLEIGDRIGVSGATVDEETLGDEEGGDTIITFNGDSGLFDFFGTDVSIKAKIPDGAILRLADETLDDGGSIIEVVLEGTQIEIQQDFLTATVEESIIRYDINREGDTSFPITVFVDGETPTPGYVFNDFSFTLPAGQENVQLPINLTNPFSNTEDVEFDFTISVLGPEDQLDSITIADDDARGVFIGEDGVDLVGGRAFGEPHLITFDNLAYDFQAGGDFLLARATDGDAFEVHARFRPISSFVSVVDTVALELGDATVALSVGGTFYVNGSETALPDSGTVLEVGNGSVERSGNLVTFTLASGETASVQFYNTFLTAELGIDPTRVRGTFEGLLGDFNGDPANDLTLADGTVLSTPIPIETLYGDYAESWQLDEAESFLPGVPAEFSPPGRSITVADLPPDLVAEATALVDAAGIENETLREAAILDFALTQNSDFIDAAAAIAESSDPIVSTTPINTAGLPFISISADQNALVEGDSGTTPFTFTVSRADATQTINVNFDVSSSTAAADDFGGAFPSGSIAFAAGEFEAQITVDVQSDHTLESDEEFTVTIDLPEDVAASNDILIASASSTILNDDEAGGGGGETTFPELIEKSPVAPDAINGVDRSLLVLGPDGDVQITFVDEFAAFQSTLGVYLVGENGEIINPQIVFSQIEHAEPSDAASRLSRPGGGPLSSGDSVLLSELFDPSDLDDGTEFGLFLIADGFDKNPSEIFDGGRFEFRDGNDIASITDNVPSLFHIDDSGAETNVAGDIMHSFDAVSSTPLSNTLNPGGAGQVLSGLLDGDLVIAFEDKPLEQGSDQDFNDLLIAVETLDSSASSQMLSALIQPIEEGSVA